MLKIATETQFDDLIEALAPTDVETAECLYCGHELGVCECIPGEAQILSAELYELLCG